MQSLYREQILDHFKNPRHCGQIKNATKVVEEWNPLCGDKIILSVRFDKNNVVEEVGFEGEGCAISRAAMSMLSEKMQGTLVEDLAKFSQDDMLKLLGIPITPGRLRCALLGWEAMRKVIKEDKIT